jgi:DNA-binding transcriptional LysR family regulator
MQAMAADWDDLRVFLTLAREGNLTAAARRLQVSHPTVARRVRSLEESIGARLFDRLPDRFVLTAAGEELLADSEAMERAAESIQRRSAGLGDTAHGTVRVSAGEAMTGFLADHLPRLRRGLQCIEIELAASHMLANLSRREADLLIREQVPDVSSLVARRLGRVEYAIYAGRGFDATDTTPEGLRRLTWAGFDEEHSYMPGQACRAAGRRCGSITGWCCSMRCAAARRWGCCPAMPATRTPACAGCGRWWRRSGSTSGSWCIATCGPCRGCAG